MHTRECLLERDEIIQALAHLLPVHGDHVVVQPVSNELHAVGRLRLGDFALVMRELVLQPTAVYVDCLTQILHTHNRTFQMPAGITLTPGARPLHNMVRLSFLPEREIRRILFFRRNFHAGAGHHFLDISAGKFAVVLEFRHIEIHRAVDLVSIVFSQKCFYQLDLLDDMSAGPRADIRPDAVQFVHVLEVASSIRFGQRHRMLLLSFGRLADLVFALIRIVGQMTNVGNVLHIGNAVSEIAKVSNQNIETDVTFCMPQMSVPVDGRPTDIYPDHAFVQRLELLFLSRQAIIKLQSHIILPTLINTIPIRHGLTQINTDST